MIKIICKNCSKEFKDYPSNHRLYCSKVCAYAKALKGEYRDCRVCKKGFYVVAQKVNNGQGKYCSRECVNNYIKEHGGWTRGKKGLMGANSGSFKKGEHRNPSTEFDGSYSKEKHWNWKGGITKLHDSIRTSAGIKKWKVSVFKRDNYTCQICGIRSYKGLGKTVTLHADHIKPFAYFPELRLDINNGRTLCVECHKQTDTYAGRAIKYA